MITSAKQRELVKEHAQEMHDRAGRANRDFTPKETQEFNDLMLDVKEWDERQKFTPTSGGSTGSTGKPEARFHVGAEDVYRPDLNVSFFADVNAARQGDYGAAERLHRNNQIHAREVCAGDMTTVTGAGGNFAPPGYLLDQWIALARPGRVTADLMTKQALPEGVSSVNLPKISGGSVVQVQALQNTQISDTAITTTQVTSGITTCAGQQIVALQLISQGGVGMDQVVLSDLAQDHARALDAQVISGSGASGQLRGLLNGASVGATTFTTATPKVVDGTTPANSFYNALIRARNSIATTRFLPATAIVLHPSRWSWVLEALDSSSRPLVLGQGSSFNALGISGEPVAEGASGQLLGLPVYTDAGIPTNLGAGTNQDVAVVLRAPDCFLWETDLSLAAFDAPYSNQLSILYRAHSFSALITDRIGAAVNIVSGTGMVAATL